MKDGQKINAEFDVFIQKELDNIQMSYDVGLWSELKQKLDDNDLSRYEPKENKYSNKFYHLRYIIYLSLILQILLICFILYQYYEKNKSENNNQDFPVIESYQMPEEGKSIHTQKEILPSMVNEDSVQEISHDKNNAQKSIFSKEYISNTKSNNEPLQEVHQDSIQQVKSLMPNLSHDTTAIKPDPDLRKKEEIKKKKKYIIW